MLLKVLKEEYGEATVELVMVGEERCRDGEEKEGRTRYLNGKVEK